MSNFISFGQFLKRKRKEAKKTLREAANFLGITIGNLSDIEHNRRRAPKEEKLKALELFYNLPVNTLINKANEERMATQCATLLIKRTPELAIALLHILENLNDKTILQNQGYLEENQLEIFKALSELSKGSVLCIGEDK